MFKCRSNVFCDTSCAHQVAQKCAVMQIGFDQEDTKFLIVGKPGRNQKNGEIWRKHQISRYKSLTQSSKWETGTGSEQAVPEQKWVNQDWGNQCFLSSIKNLLRRVQRLEVWYPILKVECCLTVFAGLRLWSAQSNSSKDQHFFPDFIVQFLLLLAFPHQGSSVNSVELVLAGFLLFKGLCERPGACQSAGC